MKTVVCFQGHVPPKLPNLLGPWGYTFHASLLLLLRHKPAEETEFLTLWLMLSRKLQYVNSAASWYLSPAVCSPIRSTHYFLPTAISQILCAVPFLQGALVHVGDVGAWR